MRSKDLKKEGEKEPFNPWGCVIALPIFAALIAIFAALEHFVGGRWLRGKAVIALPVISVLLGVVAANAIAKRWKKSE